ncbi:uncharacterized protein LOC143280052 [Babylonia areolata]|uniref:uncharacterized protein LOC143280052 n=1 Tax=Babylonia areolata TaxID=304850 RepID=UPI003FCF5557
MDFRATGRTQCLWILILLICMLMELSLVSATSISGSSTNHVISGSTSNSSDTPTSDSEHKHEVSTNNDYLDEDLKKSQGQQLGAPQPPCEAGQPCRRDEWCSPSRFVCRSCSDVLPWCSNTSLIHDAYPTCEGYCHDSLLKRAEICEKENDMAQAKLQEQDTAIVNLTETVKRYKEAYNGATSELKEARAQLKETRKDGKDTVIAVLACFLTVTSLWAMGVTVYLVCFKPPSACGANVDRADLQAVAQSDDSVETRLIATPTAQQEAKAPVQVHTRDTGEYCPNTGRPVTIMPGDSALVPV